MNHIERMKTVLSGGIPDRIPVIAHNFLMAAREAGITQKQYRENPELAFKCMSAAVEKYDLDGVWFDIDTTLLASACGASVAYPEDLAAVVDGVQSRAIEDLPAIVDQVDLLASERVRRYLETVEMFVEWGNRTDRFIRVTAGQGPFSLACLLTGMDEFMVDLADGEHDEAIFRLLDSTYRVSLAMHRLCHQKGVHMTGYGNSSEGCSVISPRMFRKFSLKYEKQLAAQLKAEGILGNMCHICGDVTPILKDLAETGCPAYEFDWKTDARKVFEIGYGKFVLSGNVDPALFSIGTPQEIYDRSVELCDLYRGKGGFILCSGCAIGPDGKPDCLRAMVRAAHERGVS